MLAVAVAAGCADEETPTASSTVDAEECFDGDVQVSRDDLMLVFDPDVFSDSSFAVRVSGRFAGEALLDEGDGPLGRPLDVRQLVGRRVEFTGTGLRSGGMLFVFRSEGDRADTICAVGELANSSSVTFERATLTDQ